MNQRSWVGKHGLNPNPWSIIGQAQKVSLSFWLQFWNLIGHLYLMVDWGHGPILAKLCLHLPVVFRNGTEVSACSF